MNFQAQHAIVTGGSSGIGRAVAGLLVQRGAHVSIIARRRALLEEALQELEAKRRGQTQRLQAHSADLTDWEQTQAAIALLTDESPPDFLINAAGFAHPGYFEQLPLEIFHRTMAVDYFGTLHPIKAALPAMMALGPGTNVNF